MARPVTSRRRRPITIRCSPPSKTVSTSLVSAKPEPRNRSPIISRRIDRVKIARPVVRSFHPEFARDCAAWVRAGGHAVLWETPERARLVVGHFDKQVEQDLARWANLDLGKPTYHVVKRGPFRGLVPTPVPDD